MPLVILAAALIGTATAQEPAGRIQGQVVGVRGEALPGAVVTATQDRPDRLQTISDQTGRFVLAGLPLDECRVSAAASGHHKQTDVVWLDGRRPAAQLRLQLLEAAEVQGHVRDVSGKPLPSTLLVFAAPEKFFGPDTDDHAWTDAEGFYRLPEVPLGKVRLTAIGAGHDAREAEIDLSGPLTQDFELQPGPCATYRVAVRDATPAQWAGVAVILSMPRNSPRDDYQPWDLGALWPRACEDDTLVFADLPANLGIHQVSVRVPHGATEPSSMHVVEGSGTHEVYTTVVPLRHEWRTPVVARGILRDLRGSPLAGRRVAQRRRPPDVCITAEDGSFTLPTTATDSGFFVLELDEDDYVLHIEGATEGRVREAGRYFHHGPGLEPLALVADRAARVSGTVVDSAGVPVPLAQVELVVNSNEHRADVNGFPDQAVASADTASDGTFVMGRLDGHLGLHLWFRITSTTGTHGGGPFEVGPGQTVALGTITMSAPATIEGTILDQAGRPRCGIEVYLWRHDPAGPPIEKLWRSHTGHLGCYGFHGLPPGDYSVLVDSPHAMHAPWPDYGRVTLRAGEHAVVTRLTRWNWLLILSLLVAGPVAMTCWWMVRSSMQRRRMLARRRWH